MGLFSNLVGAWQASRARNWDVEQAKREMPEAWNLIKDAPFAEAAFKVVFAPTFRLQPKKGHAAVLNDQQMSMLMGLVIGRGWEDGLRYLLGMALPEYVETLRRDKQVRSDFDVVEGVQILMRDAWGWEVTRAQVEEAMRDCSG